MYYGDILVTFSEFKKHYPLWNFESNTEQATSNFNLMKSIWTAKDGFVGKKFCEHFKMIYHDNFI